MQNTVHKKNNEHGLWELEAPVHEKKNRRSQTIRENNSAKANRTIKPIKSRELQTLDIAGSPRYKNANMDRVIERRRARRRRAYFYRALAVIMLTVVLVLFCLVVSAVCDFFKKDKVDKVVPVVNTQPINEIEESKVEAPEIEVDLLDVNEYSRPATKISKIKNIFVHYTANPETSAKQNRSYFANLAETHERSASAHYIIGYEGEIIQCIPLNEQAFAVMTRNEDSISIECCYLDKDGQFTQETYDSLIHLLAWLIQEYDLEAEDILRHYDCGGKLCPIYYVEHEDAWTRLLRDVERFH